MNDACVIGMGMVGNATATLFGIKKHFDIIEEKSNITLEEVAKCRFVFICIPTPSKHGYYKQEPIFNLIEQIEQYGGGSIYIIRSTVSPGFALHIQKELGINRIVSNPEFLTEATWEKDVKHPPFILLGGFDGVYLDEVKGIYDARIKSDVVILTDNTTAEFTKLVMNGFFSLKVIFANQMYDAARAVGANYERMREVLEKHPFGPRNHFKIWFNGKRGIGGRCLPKDTEALAHYANSDLVKKVVELNKIYVGARSEN